MNLLSFALGHKRILSFGVLCAMASGFGQTFFVSLSVPQISAHFDLSKTAFGTIYGVATVLSGLALPVVGAKIDGIDLKRFVLLAMSGVALAALTLSISTNVILLAAGLFGVRFAGQGLMSHTASTTMSRVFNQSRGKALSVASLGYPLSEALFPVFFTALVLNLGWRGAWGLCAAVVVVVILPLAQILLRPWDTNPSTFRMEDDAQVKGDAKFAGTSWTRGQVLRDFRVWLLLPFWLAPPFILTGFFFHQLSLVEEKKWDALFYAGAFAAFALARAVSSFLIGPLVDRIGARRILPFSILPLLLGLAILVPLDAPWVAVAYLALAGSAVGLGSNVKSAFIAELFGVRHLGAIRSTLLTAMILSTAASPPLFGWALENGFTMAFIAQTSAMFIGGALILCLWALAMLRRSG